MNPLVQYQQSDAIASIVMDDGKLNIMSVRMLQELHAAFNRAEREADVIILTSGRAGIFSAGFDTKILARKDPQETYEMVKLGAELALRVLSFPKPVLGACTGHAYPMGAFLLLASDIRIGTDGPFKIGLNEVAIGIPVPSFALELARARLNPAHFQRTALTGEMFAPPDALTAGFFDRVVPTQELRGTADTFAAALSKIDLPSHASTKARLRKGAVDAVRKAIDGEITLELYKRLASAPSGTV